MTWAQDGANPNNARWAVLINLTRSNKGVGFMDLGQTIDMTLGALTINPAADGVFHTVT